MEKTASHLKILAIDDEEESLSFLAAVLGHYFPGIELRTALSGPEGLRSAAAEPPGLIFLDIAMPEMDGFEVCRRLKAEARTSAIPVVFLTGGGTDGAKRLKALEAGVEGFLGKPLNEADLVVQIRGMIKIVAANAALRAEQERLSAQLQERTRLLGAETCEHERTREARQEAETGLRRSEERFNDLLRRAPLGYQSLDENGNFLEVNSGWCDALGYAKPEVIGKWFGDLLPPERRDGFREWFAKFKAQGETQCELELLRKDGSRRLVAFYGGIAHKPDGGFLRTHCVLRDITDSRLAEAKLRQLRLQNELILNSVEEGIIGLDSLGNQTFVNPAAAKMLGYEPAELIGRPAHAAWHHTRADGTPYPEKECRILSTGGRGVAHREEGEVFWRKDGTSFPVEYSCLPVYEDGRHTGFVLTFLDITKRKSDQQRFELLNPGLATLGPDYEKNIAGLVELACRVLGSDAGLYNRLHGDKLKVEGAYKLPPDMALEDKAEGHICHHVITRVAGEMFELLRRLQASTYFKTDPNVSKYGLQTYLGCRVRLSGTVVGSLALVWGRDWEPGPGDLKLLGIIAAAVEAEEKRRQAQQALRRSEEQYRHLVENVGKEYFLYQCDAAGRFTYISPSVTAMLGYSAEEFRDHHRGLPADAPENKEAARPPDRSARGGQARQVEIFHKDGSTRWLELKETPLRGPDGKVTGVEGIAHDMTGRRQEELYQDVTREVLQILNKSLDFKVSAERLIATLKARGGFDAVGLRLQQGEDFPYFFQEGFPEDFLLVENTLVQRAEDGGLCRDKDGKVSLECTCGLVISGKSSPALTKGGSFWTNDSFTLLGLPADQDPRLRPRNNCIHKKYASVALIPMRSGDAIVGLLQLNSHKKGCFSDAVISRLESLAASIGEALMRKRAEAERAEMQARLLHSQKMESVGRLAGGVAHDFNNLLTAIKAYSEFLVKALPDGDTKKEDAREISAAADRAASLTQQLLAFSRKQLLKPEVLDLNGAVGGTVNMLRRVIGEDIRLDTRLAAAPCPVLIDPGQVSQILMNLAVNARDAMSKGGTLTVSTELAVMADGFFSDKPDLKRGPLVLLTVIDDGCGMTEEVKVHAFEPFFTTKEKGHGTGLGLATIYGIVKQSGGEIEIQSSPGKGTAFRIYLPQAADLPAQAVESVKASGGKETILYVDDDEQLRRLGARILAGGGYKVVAAASGPEGLKALEALGRPADLIITDVVMPGMSGREMAKEAFARKLAAKVLYVSGYTDEAIVTHGVMEPGLAFMYKPFNPDSLLIKIRSLLDGPAGEARA